MMATNSHDCPGQCGKQVPRHLLACKWCWYRLPIPLRHAVTTNHQRDERAHRAAMTDAFEWYRNHPKVVQS